MNTSIRSHRLAGRTHAAWLRIFLVFFLLAALCLFPAAGRAAPDNVIFVDDSANGANNGTSWTDAYTSLQSALTAAADGHEIWVAEGTYKPGSLRSNSFILKSGVAVYGGFSGSETSRTERNWAANATILSGDIGVEANKHDNCYHVVSADGVSKTAVLDGFTITGGNTDGASSNENGGGMYLASSSPTLNNLTIIDNSAAYGGGLYISDNSNQSLTNVAFSGNTAYQGGGIFNDTSSPALINVIFSGNSADIGGGIYNFISSPTLTNITFIGNSANDNGGGMYNDTSSPTLTNITFSGNHGANGGGMYNYNSSPTLTNVIFSNNTASIEGGGMGNDNSCPTLTGVTFSSNSAVSHGGGMANSSNSNPTLTDASFMDNSAAYGGAMHNAMDSNPTLTNLTFSNNSASTEGGGCSMMTAIPC